MIIDDNMHDGLSFYSKYYGLRNIYIKVEFEVLI